MAKLLSTNDLKDLTSVTGGWCISVYIPTHRKRNEFQQGSLRLKNLLAEAQKKLESSGVRSSDAVEILKPAWDLQKDDHEWQNMSDGLAIFITAGRFEWYSLPVSFDEQLVVSHRFYIKPLIQYFASEGKFYLLSISQNKVRMFEGDRYGLKLMDTPGIPASLEAALNLDEPEKQLHSHSAVSTGHGRSGVIFHGQEVGTDDRKASIHRFCNLVDHGVRDLMKDKKKPLVLAAVDYIQTIYKETSEIPSLLDHGVEGNPDDLSETELHSKAWKIVEPAFHGEMDKAVLRYEKVAGSERASTDLSEILHAATGGKVDVLFIAAGSLQWGFLNPETGDLKFADSDKSGYIDLLDYAAVETLNHGGIVYAIPPDQMPGGSTVASVFRY